MRHSKSTLRTSKRDAGTAGAFTRQRSDTHFRRKLVENAKHGHTKFGSYAGNSKITAKSKRELVKLPSGEIIKSHAQKRPDHTKAGKVTHTRDPKLLAQYA